MNLKDLFTNRERRHYPEVVVPLPRGCGPSLKMATSDDSKDSLDRASRQEKGDELTVESLRAEVEANLVATGHDSVYDRMSLVQPICLLIHTP